jgi:peptidyl-Lys metalloendopeptidase
VLKNKGISVILFVIAFAMFATTTFAARQTIQVSVKMNKTAYQTDENIPVNISLTNTGKRDVQILRWKTTLEGVKEDLFEVTLDGKPVEYIGPDYKRPAPVATDYITIKGGENLESTIDISGFYDFSETGLYEIRYKSESQDQTSKVVSLQSEASQSWIEGRETKVAEDIDFRAVTGSTSFTSCSTTRQGQLTTARSNASTYATNSYNYLNAGTQGSRYTTWFGTYSSTRYSTVRSHFLNIRNAMDTAGTDSKAGTLVHEMSHFNVVAATDDWAYGQTAAKNLARTNTTRAVDNADSHEYFAENTPSLP